MREEAERAVQWKGITPMEFLESVMNAAGEPCPTCGHHADTQLRIDAAKAAAPYVHRKQPEAREISGQVTLPCPIIILNDHK